jgi:hypothetical protein
MYRFTPMLALILIFGCNSPNIEIDYGGGGDFIIINHSLYEIKAVLFLVPQLGNRIDTTEIIKVDSSKIVFHDAVIGSNVTPAVSFQAMDIYRVYPDSLSKVYTQNPIDESKWTILRNYSGDFGLTTNTFEFTGK